MFNKPTFWDRITSKISEKINIVRRAFREFLAFPTMIIVLFFFLAIAIYVFERSKLQFSSPIYAFFKSYVFADAEATSDLLGNIAGSIITVTSITITLLLLIVQQSASNLTTQVFDQFLRRRSNQFYFGYFVGVAVYTLITLATVDEPFNPVLAAMLVFFFTVIALFLLMVLFYSTIHQMRSPVILAAIHGHALSARKRQLDLIRRTRRESIIETPLTHDVLSHGHGFVTEISLDQISEAVDDPEEVYEVVFHVTIGSFVAYQDRIAEVKITNPERSERLVRQVRGAVQLERSRDLANDPTYGIKQLETIAWAVTSPSKSNLAPGVQAIFLMKDMLARWIEEDEEEQDEEEPLPIVYQDDVRRTLIHTFESLAVVASISKAHQISTEILAAFTALYNRLPKDLQQEVEESIRRVLPTLEEHVLTANLEGAWKQLAIKLLENGRTDIAHLVQEKLNIKRNGDEEAPEESEENS